VKLEVGGKGSLEEKVAAYFGRKIIRSRYLLMLLIGREEKET